MTYEWVIWAVSTLFTGLIVFCLGEVIWHMIFTPKYERPKDSKTYRP